MKDVAPLPESVKWKRTDCFGGGGGDRCDLLSLFLLLFIMCSFGGFIAVIILHLSVKIF